MLKDNSMYQQADEIQMESTDVNLTSKDMEINFSNRQDDDDELAVGMTPNDASAMEKDFPKGETLDFNEDAVPGVASDFKIVEKLKILEEQKGD